MINLDGRIFSPVENTENGTVDVSTRFEFWQNGDVFYADYSGGDVRDGHIIGQFTGDNSGTMLYHCMTKTLNLKAGKANAIFTERDAGRISMDITWNWLTGDGSSGTSRYEEVK